MNHLQKNLDLVYKVSDEPLPPNDLLWKKLSADDSNIKINLRVNKKNSLLLISKILRNLPAVTTMKPVVKRVVVKLGKDMKASCQSLFLIL